MLRDAFSRLWPSGRLPDQAHGHENDHDVAHGHRHGVIDPSIALSERGVWAVKWSFVLLAVTACLQLVVVYLSGSIALAADTIHNVADAMTAIPLWIAFRLARWAPTRRFTYGYGRVEDLAGVLVVAIILFSAIVAGYEAIDRFIHPQAVGLLWWVAAAGVIGFIGNEAVAVLRIRVGREMNSAALIADGYHARTDGLTSLAVVAGTLGVALGFPLADPLVGLVITVVILGIVRQSAIAVFVRLLDGIEPGTLDEVRHVAAEVPGVNGIIDARARWSGHRLYAEIAITVDEKASLLAADATVRAFQEALFRHLPALASANVRVELPSERIRAGSGTEDQAASVLVP